VKRTVEVGGTRKPEEPHPANPDRAAGGPRAVGPPTRLQQKAQDELDKWHYWHKHLAREPNPRPG